MRPTLYSPRNITGLFFAAAVTLAGCSHPPASQYAVLSFDGYILGTNGETVCRVHPGMRIYRTDTLPAPVLTTLQELNAVEGAMPSAAGSPQPLFDPLPRRVYVTPLSPDNFVPVPLEDGVPQWQIEAEKHGWRPEA